LPALHFIHLANGIERTGFDAPRIAAAQVALQGNQAPIFSSARQALDSDGTDLTCPRTSPAAGAQGFCDNHYTKVIDCNGAFRANRDAGFVITGDAGDWQQHYTVFIVQDLDAGKLGTYLIFVLQRAKHHTSQAAGAFLGVYVKNHNRLSAGRGTCLNLQRR
jgi:hypothetical protein